MAHPLDSVLRDTSLLGQLVDEYESLKANGGNIDYRAWVRHRLRSVRQGASTHPSSLAPSRGVHHFYRFLIVASSALAHSEVFRIFSCSIACKACFGVLIVTTSHAGGLVSDHALTPCF
jgi:hypothetical protein